MFIVYGTILLFFSITLGLGDNQPTIDCIDEQTIIIENIVRKIVSVHNFCSKLVAIKKALKANG